MFWYASVYSAAAKENNTVSLDVGCAHRGDQCSLTSVTLTLIGRQQYELAEETGASRGPSVDATRSAV
jgi:hypothetical protein